MYPDRRHKEVEGLFLFHFHKLRNKDLEKEEMSRLSWKGKEITKWIRFHRWFDNEWKAGTNRKISIEFTQIFSCEIIINWRWTMLRWFHSCLHDEKQSSNIDHLQWTMSLPSLANRYSLAYISYSEYPKIPVVHPDNHPETKKKWLSSITHTSDLFSSTLSIYPHFN